MKYLLKKILGVGCFFFRQLYHKVEERVCLLEGDVMRFACLEIGVGQEYHPLRAECGLGEEANQQVVVTGEDGEEVGFGFAQAGKVFFRDTDIVGRWQLVLLAVRRESDGGYFSAFAPQSGDGGLEGCPIVLVEQQQDMTALHEAREGVGYPFPIA